MREWIVVAGAATLTASVILALPTRDASGAQENLAFLPPPNWEMGAPPSQTKDYLIMEFVKKGEKIDNWTELITLQQFRRTRSSPSPREFYEGAKALRDKACPGLSEWQIVEEKDGTLLYEWRTTGNCQGLPPQSELVRLIFARQTYYRAAFTTRAPLATEDRTVWMEWLRGLSLRR